MKDVAAPARPGQRANVLLALLAFGAVVRLWVMPLGTSLWLDEFGTAWVTGASLSDLFARARLFPQSLPYAALVWITRAALGSSEIALRLPSLAAMLAAIWCLCRLGRELFDRETGWLAAGVFLLFPQIEFSAGDARPYAFAVLASIGALWLLVRWLDRGRARDAVAYLALAAAAVYFQYLFATMLAAHAAYALRRRGRGSPVSGRQLLAAAAGLCLLLVPAAALVLEIGGRRASHAFGSMPGGRELLLSLVPSRVLGVLAPCLLLCVLLRLARVEPMGPRKDRRDALLLLVLSASVPSLLLYAVSRLSGAAVFETRYLMCAVPAQALLLGWLLRAVEPARGRRLVLGGALALVLVLRGELLHRSIPHSREDWRGAVAALNAANGANPVLLSGSFTESRDPDLVKDPAHASYLRAPLDYYPTAAPARVLPLRTGIGAETYAAGLTTASLAGHRFALIERNSRFPSWAPWFAERFPEFAARDVWSSETLRVRVFERARP